MSDKDGVIEISGEATKELTSDALHFYEDYWKRGGRISEDAFSRFQAILSTLFPSGIVGKRVLEIGVGGEGGFIFHLKDRNEVHGLDASAAALENCRRFGLPVRIFNADTDRIPFEDGFFDVVFASEVFEHFANPQFVLEEIRRVLKEDALAVLSTPNPLIHHWPRLFYPALFEECAFREFLMANCFGITAMAGSGINIHADALPGDRDKAWSWLWVCRKIEHDPAACLEAGMYFWERKNEQGIRTRPIEAIDMFRRCCRLEAKNHEARFLLTLALVYRSLYGEVEEFNENFEYVLKCANTETYTIRLKALLYLSKIYLEMKAFGLEPFPEEQFRGILGILQKEAG